MKKRLFECILLLLLLVFNIYLVILLYNYSHDLGLYHLIGENEYASLINAPNILLTGFLLCLFFFGHSFFRASKIVKITVSVRDRRIDIVKALCCLIIVLSCALPVVEVIGCKKLFHEYSTEATIVKTRELLQKEKTVIHACGLIRYGDKAYSYTNSSEALENCYADGNRVAEIDFMFANDGRLVCAHDGEDDIWAYGFPFSEAPSDEEFLRERVLGYFKPMDMDYVADFMRKNGDFYVVTDIKDDNIRGCKYIAENYPDIINRIIVQIYHITEYNKVKRMGFDNIIFTLYQCSPEEIIPQILLKNSKEYDLVGITFWEEWMEDRTFFDEISINAQLPLFVHTVNDKQNISRDLERGVLIYTDNTQNDWIRERGD